jgi:3'-5' exoribonuclease
MTDSAGKQLMSRIDVSQLGDKQSISEVYLASNKQLRANRNGNLYLTVELSDRTGSIPALKWNAKESDGELFDSGDYVKVTGSTQLYQGSLQLIATGFEAVSAESVDEEDFLRVSRQKVDELAVRCGEILRGIADPQLRTIADCFLMDEELMAKVARAPAGVKNHHDFHGGLLEHVVNLMEVVLLVRTRYPQINGDLLLMGAFLHDLGKIDELSYDRDFSYTDVGQLIGHLVMAVSMLERKVAEAEKLSGEPISEELVLRLKHMIVSHHGHYEFGSPKLPMTLEAIALHHLDDLDAKVHSFEKLMADDPNAGSPWTTYHPNLGRKLYKGSK